MLKVILLLTCHLKVDLLAGLSQEQLLEYAIFATITEKLHSYKASAHPILTLGEKITQKDGFNETTFSN